MWKNMLGEKKIVSSKVTGSKAIGKSSKILNSISEVQKNLRNI
jgi:hypothetical protein